MRFILALFSVFLLFSVSRAGDAGLARDIDLVRKHGRSTPEGQAAWERLSQAGPTALPLLLEGINTRDTVVANWFRTALDQVVDRELKAGGKKIDAVPLLAFVKDASKDGRARRYAQELAERLKPGISEQLRHDWLDDPEFRHDAVAQVLDRARQSLKSGNNLIAVNLFRQAFSKSRDIQQARDAAAGLLAEKEIVSVASHLGFLVDWHLIGPFDGKGQKGFHLTYPPEKKVDLTEELDGQNGKVRWKPYRAVEPAPTSSARHQALVDLRSKTALGDADDAVAFAYTEFHLDQPIDAEMRGSADDNLTVYVNGTKVFAFEEWRNGVRHDRHRFAVKLKAGKNTVLVKVCQSAAPNPEPNWEFVLRVVDATGLGITRKK